MIIHWSQFMWKISQCLFRLVSLCFFFFLLFLLFFLQKDKLQWKKERKSRSCGKRWFMLNAWSMHIKWSAFDNPLQPEYLLRINSHPLRCVCACSFSLLYWKSSTDTPPNSFLHHVYSIYLGKCLNNKPRITFGHY